MKAFRFFLIGFLAFVAFAVEANYEGPPDAAQLEVLTDAIAMPQEAVAVEATTNAVYWPGADSKACLCSPAATSQHNANYTAATTTSEPWPTQYSMAH